MTKRKLKIPLRCRIIEGVLTIEVGIETLKWAAEHHEDFWQPETDKYAIVVAKPEKFAKDVRDALTRELGEDGSTAMSAMLDQAVLKAVENGSEGLDYDAMDAIEKAERAANTSNSPQETT